MAGRWRWLGVLLLLLGACSAPAAPGPASDNEITAAVNATATALAASAPAAPASAPAPTAVLGAPTAAPTVAPILPASPTIVLASATPPTVTAGTPATTASPATGAATTPRPAGTGSPSVPLTVEEATYVRNVTQLIRDYNRSFDRFRELLSQVDPSDAGWRLAFGAELQFWLSSADTIRAIRPPPSLATVHQRVSRGADLYQQSAQQLLRAIEAADEEQLRQGLTTVTQARQSFDDAERELARIARERGL